MQLERNYRLPNCTLALEGMGDPGKFDSLGGGLGSQAGAPLAILVQASCEILDQTPVLRGGLTFLTHLSTAVSRYAQECLSGVQRRHSLSGGLVQLQGLENGRHRLLVFPEEGEGSGTGHTPIEMELTTVQLFDLVEAVDQFLADPQTLPDLGLLLNPIPKREVPSQESMAQRAVGPALGVSGLAIAAAALFTLPVPTDIRRPGTATQPTQTAASPGPAKLPTGLETPNSTITDPDQLETIQAKLQERLTQAWASQPGSVEGPGFSEDLIYRVTTGQDAQIVGYRALNAAATDFDKEVPLSELVYLPPDGSNPTGEPVAEFRVRFTPEREVKVEPWSAAIATAAGEIAADAGASETPADSAGFSPAPSSLATPSPTASASPAASLASPSPDAAEPNTSSGASSGASSSTVDLNTLTERVYDALDQRWTADPTFTEALTYRVEVDSSGKIQRLAPVDSDAEQYAQELGLEGIASSGGAQPSDLPSASASSTSASATTVFQAIFKPNGVLEVSPWDGYVDPQ